MASSIFLLNYNDYSENVVAENYNVNYEDVYQEWIDGGQVKHRDVIGKKLRGTFQMYFNTAADLQSFLTYMSMLKYVDNTYPVRLKANNETIDTLIHARVFLDFQPVRKRNPRWEDVFEVFEVTVEEP